MTSSAFHYRKLSDLAFPPVRGSPDAAGCDLRSAFEYIVPRRGQCLIKTDLSFELPPGCYGRIAPRSGLALRHSIGVNAGVIDRDYTGNVGVILTNNSDTDFVIKPGDRIAQIILEKYNNTEPRECVDIRETVRGSGGFGSTGIRGLITSMALNMVITLEGNIGSGKSTFATGLFEQFKNLGIKAVHIQEPLGAWVDFHGTNLLSLLYKDIERWAFTFQVNALMYMTECDRRAIEYVKRGYIVIKERSAFSVKNIFNKHMEKFMTPSEIQILSDICSSYVNPRENAVAEGVKDVTLYLRTNPETCFQRKLKRNRPEEIGKKNRVDEVYLKDLHEIHEMAIHKSFGKVIICDGTRFDPKNIKESVRVADTGDLVFDVLLTIIGINADGTEMKSKLEDEWTPERDRITRECE